MPISSWNIGATSCNASLSTESAIVIALNVLRYSTGTRSFSWKKSVMYNIVDPPPESRTRVGGFPPCCARQTLSERLTSPCRRVITLRAIFEMVAATSDSGSSYAPPSATNPWRCLSSSASAKPIPNSLAI